MNKNRFFLIIILGIVILTFLYNNYQKTKKETLANYQYYQQLLSKIKEIEYLQNKYSNTKILNKIKQCHISNNNKITLICNNLTKQNFEKISNIIFNSNLNISKFKITKNSIYVEIKK